MIPWDVREPVYLNLHRLSPGFFSSWNSYTAVRGIGVREIFISEERSHTHSFLDSHWLLIDHVNETGSLPQPFTDMTLASYPNPVTSASTVRFHLPRAGEMVLSALLSTAAASLCHAQGAAGIEFIYDSTRVYSRPTGSPERFELRARNERLEIVENWDYIGKDVALTVRGSNAETDTSTRSWSNLWYQYTWVKITIADSVLELDSITFVGAEPLLHYTIPKELFENGRAALWCSQSAPDTAVVLSIAPRWNFLRQETPPLRVEIGGRSRFKVELTSQTGNPNEVYLRRRYEIVVTPHDLYLNIDYDNSYQLKFDARSPAEFDRSLPGLSNIFDRKVGIKGPTDFMLASRIARPDSIRPEDNYLQCISVRDVKDTSWFYSNSFAILHHRPNPLQLLQPVDSTRISLDAPDSMCAFSWSKSSPPDPYTDIRISRFDTTRYSDEIAYTIRFMNASYPEQTVEYCSDNNGSDTTFTCDQRFLADVRRHVSILPSNKDRDLIWCVQATDDLYITEPSPPGHAVSNRKGFYLEFQYPVVDGMHRPEARALALEQNYPNPFNPTTVIPVELVASGHCTLQVLDLMGKVVAVLHDAFLEAGLHRFSFDGRDLPTGVYSYRIIMEGAVHTRSMLLLR